MLSPTSPFLSQGDSLYAQDMSSEKCGCLSGLTDGSYPAKREWKASSDRMLSLKNARLSGRGLPQYKAERAPTNLLEEMKCIDEIKSRTDHCRLHRTAQSFASTNVNASSPYRTAATDDRSIQGWTALRKRPFKGMIASLR